MISILKGFTQIQFSANWRQGNSSVSLHSGASTKRCSISNEFESGAVGNKRTEISERTIGIPVIAVGIPTVVDAATLANDTIDIVIDQMTAEAKAGGKFFEMLGSIDREEKEKMIKEVLHPYVGDLMVTPKEVDMVIESVAKILANGINIALQPALDLEDINKYIN